MIEWSEKPFRDNSKIFPERETYKIRESSFNVVQGLESESVVDSCGDAAKDMKIIKERLGRSL